MLIVLKFSILFSEKSISLSVAGRNRNFDQNRLRSSKQVIFVFSYGRLPNPDHKSRVSV